MRKIRIMACACAIVFGAAGCGAFGPSRTVQLPAIKIHYLTRAEMRQRDKRAVGQASCNEIWVLGENSAQGVTTSDRILGQMLKGVIHCADPAAIDPNMEKE